MDCKMELPHRDWDLTLAVQRGDVAHPVLEQDKH